MFLLYFFFKKKLVGHLTSACATICNVVKVYKAAYEDEEMECNNIGTKRKLGDDYMSCLELESAAKRYME